MPQNIHRGIKVMIDDANAEIETISAADAITLIGKPSARCRRRISAQSSTDNIPFWPSWLDYSQATGPGGQFSVAAPGSEFTCR